MVEEDIGSSIKCKKISYTLFSKIVKHAPGLPISVTIMQSIDVFLKIVVCNFKKEYIAFSVSELFYFKMSYSFCC